MTDETPRTRTPRLRFPEFREAGEWKYEKLAPFLEEFSKKVPANTNLPIYSSSRAGLKAQKDYYDGRELANESQYGVVPNGYLVYRHMSDDGVFKFNINDTGQPIAVSKEYPVFRTNNLNSYFLLYKLNYGTDFKRFAIIQKKGGTRTRLYLENLRSWETFLPSLPEQQRIADCLNSIDEVIDAHRAKLDALAAHKRGLMQQLFPAEGETVPRLRFPEFADAGEWEVCRLEELVDVIDGDRGVNYPKSDDLLSSGYCAFLNAKNVTKNGFAFDEIQFITKEKDLSLNKGKLRRLDIILTTRGSVGNFAFFSEDIPYEHMRINSGMVILRLSKKNISTRYLYTYLKSELMSKVINTIAFGSAQPQLTVSEIKKFPACYPGIFEQQRIADVLSGIDEQIAEQRRRLDGLRAHKRGLMQQLFPSDDEVQE